MSDVLEYEKDMQDVAKYEASFYEAQIRAIKKYEKLFGKTFIKHLIYFFNETDTIDDEWCTFGYAFGDGWHFVKTTNIKPDKRFAQSEKGLGIVYVEQYSSGMEGDSWHGTVWVKLPKYKNRYLEIKYEC